MNAATTTPTFRHDRPALARLDLVCHSLSRFHRLANCMSAGGLGASREVRARLASRLATIYPLEVREFAGAAAGHIRAALLELAQEADQDTESDELGEWVRVHRGVDQLPQQERELFDLLLYWGMTESKVAALLGVSPHWIGFRWFEERLALHEAIRQEGIWVL